MSRTQDREIGKIKRKTSKRKNIKRKIKPKIKQCSFYKCKWNKVIYCQEKKNIHSQTWYNKIIKLKHKKDSKMKTKRKHGQWYMKDKINSIYELSRRRQWHPTPVLLPGKSHGWRSLEDCSPWGRWGSDTTEQLHFHFSLSCIGEKTATHSSVLAWRIPGTGEPGGLPSMGSHRVGHDWNYLAAAWIK